MRIFDSHNNSKGKQMNAKTQSIVAMASILLCGAMSSGAALSVAFGESTAIPVDNVSAIVVEDSLPIDIYWPTGQQVATILLDGKQLVSSIGASYFEWRPSKTGRYVLACETDGEEILRKEVRTVPDPNIAITPPTRNFGTGGGGAAIVTSGSGTWDASASDDWIAVPYTNGAAGHPVAYTVSATTNVEPRTGYVYVSGHIHTVTQEGLGGSIAPESATFEWEGGNGEIEVTAPERIGWRARANSDWLRVANTSGTGPGTLTYTVTRFDEVSTRQGTLTVAGNTFTVFQYGRRMKLSPTSATYDYLTHVIPITVDALAITEWDVEPNNSWISVVDGGNGKGSDLVTIAIGENPSWLPRNGTVRIGTETFTVTQGGRTMPALAFEINPEETTASVEGANGLIGVTATPDLPWAAASQSSWLTIYSDYMSGAGNGNVAYSASPNPTLYERTGTITVTPVDTNVAAKTHTVTQPAALSALSANGYEFEAAGESCEVRVSLANIVQWEIENTNEWLTVVGATNRVGPGTVTLQAEPNDTVYPKSGTVTIARRTFEVSQLARGVEVEYDTKLFGSDGGYESISIHPDGNVAWTAVSSDETWITILPPVSGTGDGEVVYTVAPYVGDGEARTGTITVGDKVVYISQRAYDLSIDPTGAVVPGNSGVGEFAVSASIDAVWTAIATEPWITTIPEYDAGTGNGVVKFAYMDNDAGKPRTGKIIVAGEVYTLTQQARQMVAITTDAEHGGTVAGAGSYDLGTTVELTAIPDSGYAFSYWTGDVESMENPLTFVADVPKSVTAVFEALPIAFARAESTEEGVWLGWNNLAWATTYRIFRGTTSVPSSAEVVAEIPNTGLCEWLDETGEVDVEYWYWVEAEGVEDDVTSDPMTGKKLKPIVISPIVYENLRGAENPNPATYQEETTVKFAAPGAVEGYTFAGWTPPQITAEMTGTQTVTAAWTANRYLIAYNPNGGSGTMESTACTYDEEAVVAGNEFTRWGWRFAGWATEAEGAAVYGGGETVSNLTAQSEGVVTLFATWRKLEVATPEINPPDGTVFLTESCEVSISCATEGAAIYFSTDGTTPRVNDAFLYAGPFALTNTATVKALAVLEGERSGYATATITRRMVTLAEAAGAPELSFVTGGDAEWRPMVDESAAGGFSAGSGTVADEEASWMEVTLTGTGTLRFDWRVDCEQDEGGEATWDHATVSVDGAEVVRIDGTTAWATVPLEVEGDGEHVVRWAFSKDDFDEAESEFADRVWVTGVMWMPDVADDPIPAVTDDSEVAGALEGSADPRLALRLTTAEAYNDYRAWVTAKGLDRWAVKNSPHAWISYALGAEVLFENEPTILLGAALLEGEGASLEVSVTVNDGENAATVDAGKVAGMFVATSDLGDWAGPGKLVVTATQTGSDGATMRFAVTMGDGTDKAAFLRLAP